MRMARMWERLANLLRESRRYEPVSVADRWLVCLDDKPVARIKNPQDADMFWFTWEISSYGDAPIPSDLWAYDNDARRSFVHELTKERTEAIPGGDCAGPDGRIAIRSLYLSRFSLGHFLVALITRIRILKYTPAAVLTLLVLAWVASWFFAFVVGGVFAQRFVGISFGDGVLGVTTFLDVNSLVESGVTTSPRSPNWLSLTGNLAIHFDGPSIAHHFVHVDVPMVILITLGMPLAVGPFLSYRFRLWHYLAYTALVALELAYYLRWQG